jgi:hypothetical protein
MSANFSEHPDSNLLAAFAEHTLRAQERAGIAEHLARCAACREHLFLACAAAEPGAARTTRSRFIGPFHAGLLIWPLAASLGIAVCLVLFTLRSAQVSPPNSSAKLAGAKPNALIVPASTKVEESIQQPNRLAGHKPALPGRALAQADGPIARPAFTFARPATAAVSRVHPATSAILVSAPIADSRTWTQECRWRITAPTDTRPVTRGKVQRSFDGGNTWETLPLRNNVSFRAVGSSGAHVWAGGSRGLLLYSSDDGGQWTHISVADRNTRLTGDIVRIDALGPERVKLTTSSGERWLGFNENWHRLEDDQDPQH